MNSGTLAGGVVSLALLTAAVQAQSYRDLTIVRDRPSPFTSVLQLRAGALASFTENEIPANGAEDEIGWDGHVYYHQDQFGGRPAVLDVYAGRDGAYASVLEGDLFGQETQSRLEVSTRYFPFYREGFYNGDNFIPTGRYEGTDYTVALSLASQVAEGVRVEAGAFYRRMSFDTNSDTAPGQYTIPDDHNAYGGRLFLEQSTLVLDRVTGRPEQGFILTIGVEREQNDSSATFGRLNQFERRLPSGLWRGFGHLEWYFRQNAGLIWLVEVDGSVSDKEDSIYNYDAQKPLGHTWIDGKLGLRVELGDSFWVTPNVRGQWIRILNQTASSTDEEFFFGGGIDLGLDLGDSFSIVGEYSYLENPSREPVSISGDTYGEHRAFLGAEIRFGAQRR